MIKNLFKWIFILCVLILLISIIFDIKKNSQYKPLPKEPDVPIHTEEDKIYLDLVNNHVVDWNALQPSLQFIKKEYDVADFKLVNLIRILYEFENKIPPVVKQSIDTTLLNFRYWMDEPGQNSMCYWSENHQILFSSAEYLIGKKYYNANFTNSQLSGKQHMEKAKKRILNWLELRWINGFSEFYSATYYIEDIAALINLIDHSEDDEIISKATIILDLIFYDVATQQLNGLFSSVSGRAYKDNRCGKSANLGGAVDFIFGNKNITHGLLNGLITTKYEVPQVFKEIATDTMPVTIKQKNGLNISQLNTKEYLQNNNKLILMQWGMEAFVNPRVIRNTMHTIRKNKMFTNDFLKDLKAFNFTFIRLLHLEPLIVRILNLPQQGKAIPRANTYTFKTKDYSLYTVQNYLPGRYADQQHVAGFNVGNSFSVFHTHPAREKNIDVHSPNYWVGYGRLPHAVQEKNISLAIYNIPNTKNIVEKELLDYTFAYFPKNKFDSIVIKDNYAFGKKGNTYCALISKNSFFYRDSSNEELIQKGRKNFWIIVGGRFDDDGSFYNFYQKILHNKIAFDEKKMTLKYVSDNNEYILKYNNDFFVNHTPVPLSYKRFDSKYILNYNNDEVIFKYNEKQLKLNFNKSLYTQQ